jgi:hypothetical protein
MPVGIKTRVWKPQPENAQDVSRAGRAQEKEKGGNRNSELTVAAVPLNTWTGRPGQQPSNLKLPWWYLVLLVYGGTPDTLPEAGRVAVSRRVWPQVLQVAFAPLGARQPH